MRAAGVVGHVYSAVESEANYNTLEVVFPSNTNETFEKKKLIRINRRLWQNARQWNVERRSRWQWPVWLHCKLKRPNNRKMFFRSETVDRRASLYEAHLVYDLRERQSSLRAYSVRRANRIADDAQCVKLRYEAGSANSLLCVTVARHKANFTCILVCM